MIPPNAMPIELKFWAAAFTHTFGWKKTPKILCTLINFYKVAFLNIIYDVVWYCCKEDVLTYELFFQYLVQNQHL